MADTRTTKVVFGATLTDREMSILTGAPREVVHFASDTGEVGSLPIPVTFGLVVNDGTAILPFPHHPPTRVKITVEVLDD